MKNNEKLKGFSIIELSMSLFVIGVIILATMSSMQAIGENLAATKTEMRIENSVNILSTNLVTKAVNINSELRDQSIDLWLPNNDNGTKLVYETDGYGNNFTYIPAESLTYQASSNKAAICSSTNTNLALEYTDKAGVTNTIGNLAFVILGKGSNLDNDTIIDGSTGFNSLQTIVIDRKNKNDDTFRYVTLPELKYRLGCIPNVGDTFKILTNELPPLQGYMSPSRYEAGANLIVTQDAENQSDAIYGFCVQASSAREAAVLADNLVFGLCSTSSCFGTNMYSNTGIIKTDCSTIDRTNALVMRIALKEQLDPSTLLKSKPGVYKFRIFINDGSRTISKDFVQTVQ